MQPILNVEKRLLAALELERAAAAAARLDARPHLMVPAARTRPQPPDRSLRPTLATRAAVALRHALDDLLHEHRRAPVILDTLKGERESLPGSLNWVFPFANAAADLESDAARLPLREVWLSWWDERPVAQRDRDGLELIRALMISRLRDQRNAARSGPWLWLSRDAGHWFGAPPRREVQYPIAVERILEWLLRFDPPPGAADLLLDAAEFALGFVSEEELVYRPGPEHAFALDWRHTGKGRVLLDLARRHRALRPQDWQARHHARLWRLARWLDEPAPGFPRCRPSLTDLALAYEAGAASQADLLDHLLGPRLREGRYQRGFDGPSGLTRRRPASSAAQDPDLGEAARRCRKRLSAGEAERRHARQPQRPAPQDRRPWARLFADVLLGRNNPVRLLQHQDPALLDQL